MKSNDRYLEKRFVELEEKMNKKSTLYQKELEEEYKRAISELEQDIERWYRRIALNNNVSLAEAKRLLKTKELDEFKWTLKKYIKAAKENEVNQVWLKQLENASARVHIDRFTALQMQINQQIEILYAKRINGLMGLGQEIYSESYYNCLYEIQKSLGVGSPIQILNVAAIEKAILRPWAVDGMNFSSRIWQDKEKLLNVLQRELTQGFIRGHSIEKMTKSVKDKMGVSRSNAFRLVQTETSFLISAAQQEAYNVLDCQEYRFVATLDSKTSKVCQDMDRKIFKRSEYKIGVTVPPLHPRCRSTTAPYFEGNVKSRIARGSDGKTYIVPEDISYKEWKEKYVL